MGRGRTTALAVAAALITIGSPAASQVIGTLGIGASSVEYDGFLRSGAVVVSPALRFDTGRFAFAGQASWTTFESGSHITQANLATGWLSQPRLVRLELYGAGGASKYATDPGTGYLFGGARLHAATDRGGGWISASLGRFSGDGTVTPTELAAAGWISRRRIVVVGSATATWVGSQRYLDLVGVLRWTSPAAQFEARLGARSWVRSLAPIGDPIAGGYGELAAIVPMTERLALSLGGGHFPADAARQALAATYVSVGIRLRAFGPKTPQPSLLTTPAIQTRLGFNHGAARLEVVGTGDQRTILVRVSGARSVELMGDFTDWSIVALTQVAAGRWEVSLPIPAGVHRVNLRIDGKAWTAPGGGRVEETEFGGTVGLVVVP